ncbi:hypothetical protein P3T39_007163, partial [Kitasatospora sp. GP82]|nr:hypothetical protein [Kitasatospora sp. GP82]
MDTTALSYKGYRFPAEVIAHAGAVTLAGVWSSDAVSARAGARCRPVVRPWLA